MFGVSMLPVSVIIWNCSDDVVFFVFHFIMYILPISDFLYDWLMMIWLHFWFHFSLPVCLDQFFCTYSSVCIYAILVLLLVFVASMFVLKICIKYNIIPELFLWLESTRTGGNDEPVIKESRNMTTTSKW
jgi:hypothetical protein